MPLTTQVHLLSAFFHMFTNYALALNVVTWGIVAVIFVSRFLDWYAQQQRRQLLQRHMNAVLATPYKDLQKLVKRHQLKPASRKRQDLAIAIYNYQITKFRKEDAA